MKTENTNVLAPASDKRGERLTCIFEAYAQGELSRDEFVDGLDHMGVRGIKRGTTWTGYDYAAQRWLMYCFDRLGWIAAPAGRRADWPDQALPSIGIDNNRGAGIAPGAHHRRRNDEQRSEQSETHTHSG